MQAQGRATSRSKRTRSPPQKKLAGRTPVPVVTSQRQTRSSLPATASKEAARQAAVCAEEQFRIAVHKRPAPEEQRAQKKPSWSCFRLLRMKRKVMEKRRKMRKREKRRKSTHPSAAIPMTQLMIRSTRRIPRRELMMMMTMVMTTAVILA
ncbi:hypothetical protein RHMOL_Rhmol06G0000500 [Rhododendron molle]|uniref:Uncharacterized protein n=1 Tax=Rhododendron molle TaxID=49168 RepID=A0ACC0N757_RHOML|nr:hypothetical protein RHMOL_Rhmol06G0000500 [Rhododendron molle]